MGARMRNPIEKLDPSSAGGLESVQESAEGSPTSPYLDKSYVNEVHDIMNKHPMAQLIKAIGRRVDDLEEYRGKSGQTLHHHDDTIEKMKGSITKNGDKFNN